MEKKELLQIEEIERRRPKLLLLFLHATFIPDSYPPRIPRFPVKKSVPRFLSFFSFFLFSEEKPLICRSSEKKK